MIVKIPLHKLPPKKISIIFTWDDNAIRHYTTIAPLFSENNFKCTFYVVPGGSNFDSLYSSHYETLSNLGFEIGSHSYTHQYMTSLSGEEAGMEFINAIDKIRKITNRYPITFAFPNHDYNTLLVNHARQFHMETRNTLFNSRRVSLKKHTQINEIIVAVKSAISENYNLVFSGHSCISNEELQNQENGEGYEPVQTQVLSEALNYLNSSGIYADIVTFSQASIREWVKRSANLTEGEWQLDAGKLQTLNQFGISSDNIVSML